MGLWWKYVDATPPEEGAVSFEGDPEAISKRWPIIWRFGQNWHILKVENYSPFEIYFYSNGRAMCCRQLIRMRYVAVRIGPDPITFWAETREVASPPRLEKTECWIPGWLRRDRRDMWQRQDAVRFKSQCEFV